jgi:hypothetical protein
MAGTRGGRPRRRVQQINAVVSPRFLDISAKAEFVEVARGNAAEPAGYSGYLPSVGLQLWLIDEEKQLARSITALEWAIQAGVLLATQVGDDPRSEPSPSDSSGI